MLDSWTLDDYDKETTKAWMDKKRFTEGLAVKDLKVYATDRIKKKIDELVTRWRWTRDEVLAFLQQLSAKPEGRRLVQRSTR